MLRRMICEMMVLASKDNHDAAVSVPIGKVIEVLGPAHDDRFLRVNVDGREFEAFKTDVEERCAPIGGEGQRA